MTPPFQAGSGEIVRAAVASFLTAGAIQDLAVVYPAPMFDESSIAWDDLLPAGGVVRCFGTVFLDNESDTSVSWDGAGGRRVCTYDVAVELFFQDVSGDAQAAQTRLDHVITGVKQRLRFDPALGTDQSVSNIIQAAVERLEVERGRPERYGEGDTFGAWTAVRFSVDSYEYAS